MSKKKLIGIVIGVVALLVIAFLFVTFTAGTPGALQPAPDFAAPNN